MAESRSGKVTAVCISERKGTKKHPVEQIKLIPGYGVEGDAHGGSVRQVSLLCLESIEKMRQLGYDAGAGDFAENITILGIQAGSLSTGSFLKVGSEVWLRVTQIGKTCHSACEIRTLTGACIMPTEGIFAEVLSGGEVRAGDQIEIAEKP